MQHPVALSPHSSLVWIACLKSKITSLLCFYTLSSGSQISALFFMSEPDSTNMARTAFFESQSFIFPSPCLIVNPNRLLAPSSDTSDTMLCQLGFQIMSSATHLLECYPLYLGITEPGFLSWNSSLSNLQLLLISRLSWQTFSPCLSDTPARPHAAIHQWPSPILVPITWSLSPPLFIMLCPLGCLFACTLQYYLLLICLI